ncbi:aldo/keto reductase [Paenibacillus piri]|uniref:Aldo/keto reductase n=1 Tax=Paenibacillus piri TaxID=2547395 RepID=A0A4R5KN20_9BACL|nr:aldo/keto reductase [Paenibacillus piri]TDF96335.1 aldo/keto reductase [Paenibacillus piri]
MEYFRIGQSGLKSTVLTFGTALTIGTEHTSDSYANSLVDQAWRLGIRSFDTSNNYGMGEAEKLVGKALGKYRRGEYIVATKGSWPIGDSPYDRGLSRKHILDAADSSLARLGLDYVDIYYAHRYDPEVPMEEIVRTFNSLIAQGKIRYWATSEWPLEALEQCHEVCGRLQLEKPIAEQFIYSFAIRKADTNGVKPFCRSRQVGMFGFSPIAQGLLTGKYKTHIPADSRIAKKDAIGYDKTEQIYLQNKERIEQFIQLCETYRVKGSQLALSWCIKNGVYPVIGASRPEQLEENVKALDIEYPDEIWTRLERIG